MDEFLKMDIFFVVTTIAVVVLSVLLAFLIIRVLRILKNIEDISLMVEAEGQKLRDDIAQVRASVKEEGVRAKHIFDFLAAGASGKRPPKRPRQERS